MKTFLLLFVLLAAVVGVNAQSMDPQSLVRAGVHDLDDKSTALNFNPAALGPDRGYTMLWELPLSLGVGVSNNSFSVGYWNKNFAGDHNWKAADVRSILDRIPSNGMRGNFQMAVPVLGVTYKQFGFRAGVLSDGEFNLPKDLAVLALAGNKLNTPYSLSDLRGTGQVVADYALGFGYRFDQEKIPDLYFGAGFHFYQGLAMTKSAQVSGGFNFTDNGITGGAVMHSVNSTKGDGVGFDLGALATLNERWEVGLAARQIGAKLSWDVRKNQFLSAYTDSNGIGYEDFNTDSTLKSAIHKVDTTYDGGSVETKLPIVLQANGKFKVNPKLDLTGELAIRTSTTVQGRSGLELGAAAEYRPLSWLPLGGGMSVGGLWGARFAIGTGLRFRHYAMDLGAAWNGGMFNGARGASFALAHRLMF